METLLLVLGTVAALEVGGWIAENTFRPVTLLAFVKKQVNFIKTLRLY